MKMKFASQMQQKTFLNGLHVLLEPVTGPKDRLHTRRTRPYLSVESNNNNYTRNF